MTTIARYSPFAEVDRLFDDLFSRRRVDALLPPADIVEDDEKIQVSLDLPGLTQKDVEVTVQDGVLTVRGERNLEVREGDPRRFHRIERAYGQFSRSLSLPPNVEADKIDATFRDGVLTVTIPKAETAKPRRVEVKVG